MKLVAAAVLAAAALTVPTAAQAYVPNDPLVPRQWYLVSDRVFNAFQVLPALAGVKVAVIDSGVDARHPELKGRILESRSFVGGTPADAQGHGTFVAGEIAAAVDNGRGIAGLAPSARLIVAKVVRADGSISPRAEARAIQWATNLGARVINLSLGGMRDPFDPGIDRFSYAEQQAIEYAVRRGVLVVASVGNGDGAPIEPWHFASYPAALPHVVGVAAYSRSGDVPPFSNRDPVYVDLAAPGQDMFSLLPRALTARYSACVEQGYSSCGPKDYKHADGTSFAAPQVSAAAAILFALRPSLRADQVSYLLEQTAADATPASGCTSCTAGRDDLTGYGRLDVTAAVQALHKALPPSDSLEPNDDVGLEAARVDGNRLHVHATLDPRDDSNDVYRVRLRRGERISVVVRAKAPADVSVFLWKPALHALIDASDSLRAARSIHTPGAAERISYRARSTGWYSLQVKLARQSFTAYSLRIAKS